MALTLRYGTLAQLGNLFRERYRKAHGIEAFRLAKWLVDHINDGTFTQAQVRNFFDLTQQQWDALKTKWEDWKAKYEEMLSVKGE
jgi:hypothetical protein